MQNDAERIAAIRDVFAPKVGWERYRHPVADFGYTFRDSVEFISERDLPALAWAMLREMNRQPDECIDAVAWYALYSSPDRDDPMRATIDACLDWAKGGN